MMFTRSVVDPVWGVKLTGKEGKSAFGVFAAQDRFNNLIFPSNAGSWRDSFEEDTYGGVVRYRRDVGKGSSVGLLYTGRTSGDYYNHVFGVDSLVRLSRTNYVTLQAVGSQTRYPDDVAADNYQKQGNFGGKALYAKFAHYGRNLQYGISYQDLSTDFRADYGYQPRVDIRGFNAFIHPLWYGKRGGWFTRINMIMQGSRYTDTEGTLTDQNIQFGFRYAGPLQSIFTPVIHFNKEYYFGVTYNQTLFQVYYEIIPTNGVLIWGYTRIGDGVDYTNQRLADRFYTQLGLDVGLGKHLNVNFLNTYEKLRY
ncbi:MAG: hypothetical protein GY771_15200, partial [bacterium]|nr:hypothetical protein [bacterium]